MSERLKHRILLALIALTTVPYFVLVERPADWTNVSEVAQYVASCFGFIGMSLLVWQLIIGTRSVSGLYFSDLASKIKLHKLIGKYGVLLIFMHPPLIIIAKSESWLYSTKFSLDGPYETAVTYGRGAFLLLLTVWLLSIVLRDRIGFRPWKTAHYLVYPALVLVLLHIPNVGSSMTGQLIHTTWQIAVLVVSVCFVLRLALALGLGKVTYRVTYLERLNDSSWSLRLVTDGRRLEPSVGQYVYLQLSQWHGSHPFTVVDYDRETGVIEVVFKDMGRFTHQLASMAVDQTVSVDGPYGVFTKEIIINPSLPRVYIAGGIGITPFVRHALSSNADQLMFYANRNPEGAVYRDILKNRLGKAFIDVTSSGSGIGQPQIEHGRINTRILSKYIHKPRRYHYYICGPTGMVDTVVSSLRVLEVPEHQIHTELFGY